MEKIDINKIYFELTCWACPEQYNVFFKWVIVWYIRLRHWYLYAEYYKDWIEENSKVIYEYTFDDVRKWCFYTDEERQLHMNNIKQEYYNYLNLDINNLTK